MTEYEKIEQKAYDEGLQIDYVPFRSERIKGLYCNGSIAINEKIRTSAEKTCVLAEELGHYYTSSGNILDLCDVANRQQERTARLWAYNKQIGLIGIVQAFEAGCRNRYEMAEFLGVTERFLQDALEIYAEKFGTSVTIDNYMIIFHNGGISVVKMI